VPRLIDLSGKVFGRLTVIREDGRDKIERIDNDKGYSPDNCVWANKTTQSRNQRVRKTSKTGIRGVTKIKQSQLYRARINVNGKEVHLGVFEDLKEAAFARKQAELLYWGVAL
jgi:hypothetical protein